MKYIPENEIATKVLEIYEQMDSQFAGIGEEDDQ